MWKPLCSFNRSHVDRKTCNLNDIRGPEDFINEDVGLVVERDLHAVANALIILRNNPGKFNPVTIRNYILENFSSEVVSDKVVRLYKKIAGSSIK